MVVKTKALVLRGMNVGDQDRLLTMLSADLGVIGVSARGVGKAGSRLAAVAQPLMYGEYLLFQGTSRYSLNQGEVQVSFFDLATEPERYELAVRLLALAEEAATAPESAAEVLELSLHALRRLMPGTKTHMEPALVAAAFQLKLAQISGLTPHLTGCVRCGTTAIDRIRFSHAAGGFLCEACEPFDSTAVPVSAGVAKAMLYTLCAPVASLFRFELEPALTDAFQTLVERYVQEKWEWRDTRRHHGISLYADTTRTDRPPESLDGPGMNEKHHASKGGENDTPVQLRGDSQPTE